MCYSVKWYKITLLNDLLFQQYAFSHGCSNWPRYEAFKAQDHIAFREMQPSPRLLHPVSLSPLLFFPSSPKRIQRRRSHFSGGGAPLLGMQGKHCTAIFLGNGRWDWWCRIPLVVATSVSLVLGMSWAQIWDMQEHDCSAVTAACPFSPGLLSVRFCSCCHYSPDLSPPLTASHE